VFELDEATAQPVCAKLRGGNFEVDIGLAARSGDLTSAGADLVTLAGVDPVIRTVVGVLVHRDDGQCRGDVEGLQGPGEAGWLLGES
jgi:hypothetical protein